MRRAHNYWEAVSKGKKTEPRTDTKKPVVISTCNMLMIYTTLFKDGARKHKQKNIPWNKTNSACSLGLIQLSSIRYIHPNDLTNNVMEHYLR